MAREYPVGQVAQMLSKAALLKAVESAAQSRAEIARVLSLAPARITELYGGNRDLSFDEARKLYRHYRLGDYDDTNREGDLGSIAQQHNIALVEEVDLALGLGAGSFGEGAPSLGVVPFKHEWLRGLHSGPLDKLRVVKGRGDSMQPTIMDGDIVLIDTSQEAIMDQDRIWAIFWGELGMIKRVRRMPSGSYLLMSDNQSIAPFEAVDGEMHVLGRVVWIGRRI